MGKAVSTAGWGTFEMPEYKPDDKGYWNQIEFYIPQHSDAEFSHSICPECAKKLYSEFTNDNHSQ